MKFIDFHNLFTIWRFVEKVAGKDPSGRNEYFWSPCILTFYVNYSASQPKYRTNFRLFVQRYTLVYSIHLITSTTRSIPNSYVIPESEKKINVLDR